METRVLIRSGSKPTETFPHPNDASDKISFQSAYWLQRYSCLKVLTDARTDGRRLDRYTISSPLSLRLGELKMGALIRNKIMGATPIENADIPIKIGKGFMKKHAEKPTNCQKAYFFVDLSLKPRGLPVKPINLSVLIGKRYFH